MHSALIRITLALVLFATSTFAQGSVTGQNGIPTRGNLLRKPQYSTAGTGTLTLFVDGTLGNDSNNCTSAGASACLTFQGAINKAPKLLRDQLTVNAAAGTYSSGFNLSGFTSETGTQQTTGGILIDGALVNSTLATGSPTGTAAGAGQSAGTGSTYGTLCDSGATWTVNDLTGRFVTTASPTNTTLVVSSNTATCLTVVGTWLLPVAGVTTYAIQDPSVIITGTTTLAAGPVNAATVGRANIEINDNNLHYRANSIVLRNMRITSANTSIETMDNSSIRFQAMQIRPTSGTGFCFFMNTLTSGMAPNVSVANVDCAVNLSAASNGAIVIGSGTLTSTNTLWRNIGAGAGNVAISTGTGAGNMGRLNVFQNTEIRSFTNGIQLVGSPSVNFSGIRISCSAAGGSGIIVGGSTFGTAASPAALTNITTTDIAACGTGLTVGGGGIADVVSMSGSATTTGFHSHTGGLITFADAAVTLAAGVNETSLDNGAFVSTRAAITISTCNSTLGYGSRICAR